MRSFALVMFGMLVISAPIQIASAGFPAIPSWVWETCSRYPTIEVNAGGTIVMFAAKGDPRKLCAIVIEPSGSAAGEFVTLLANLKLTLARFGCWIVSPSHESIVPGSQGVVIVARCEHARMQQFLIGVHDGMVVIGYRMKW